jgi:hypothetical protein
VGHHRRLPAQDPLHGQPPNCPQPLLWQAPQDRLQEQTLLRLQFPYRKLANCLVLLYASHGSALRSRLVVRTPKHTALGGVFQASNHLWVITKNFGEMGEWEGGVSGEAVPLPMILSMHGDQRRTSALTIARRSAKEADFGEGGVAQCEEMWTWGGFTRQNAPDQGPASLDTL